MKNNLNHGELNSRQLRFIDEYLIDLNATQAAIRAGYSKKTAAEQGFALLRKPQIQQAIQVRQKELANKAGVTRERIVSELAKIAFCDMRKLFNGDGSMKLVADLDDDTAGALASVETAEIKATGEPGQPQNFTKKIRLWDKLGALEKLIKHLGLEDVAKPELEATTEALDDSFDKLREAFRKRLAQVD
ncbi:phage terminase small subunit [Collimonas sp. OK242]|nr:phage terminase small subunit [Collimonas sp. OK242]